MHKAKHYGVGRERGTEWSMPIITWLEHIQVQGWRPKGGHALWHWGTEALWEFVAAARTDWVRLFCCCCCFCSTCWSALLIIRPTTIGSAVFPRHSLPRTPSLLLLPPPPLATLVAVIPKNLLIIWGTFLPPFLSLCSSHCLVQPVVCGRGCSAYAHIHIIIIISFYLWRWFCVKASRNFGQQRLRFVSFLFAFCTFVNFNAVILFLFLFLFLFSSLAFVGVLLFLLLCFALLFFYVLLSK